MVENKGTIKVGDPVEKINELCHRMRWPQVDYDAFPPQQSSVELQGLGKIVKIDNLAIKSHQNQKKIAYDIFWKICYPQHELSAEAKDHFSKARVEDDSDWEEIKERSSLQAKTIYERKLSCLNSDETFDDKARKSRMSRANNKYQPLKEVPAYKPFRLDLSAKEAPAKAAVVSTKTETTVIKPAVKIPKKEVVDPLPDGHKWLQNLNEACMNYGYTAKYETTANKVKQSSTREPS